MIVTGYFDTSGKHPESNGLAVGGFFARGDEWGAFEYEWETALKEWGVDAFHMSAFESRRSPFDWSDEQRRERLGRLLRIINGHVLASVGVVIPYETYDRYLSERAEMQSGGPLSIAGMVVLDQAARLIEPLVPDAELAYVYEQGEEGKGQFLKVFDDNYRIPSQRAKWHLLSIRFEDKRRFLPLQAADILAYELYRDIPRKLGLEQRDRRYPLVHFYAKPNNWSWFGEENMRTFGEVITLGLDHSVGTWNKSTVSPRSAHRSRRRSKRDP